LSEQTRGGIGKPSIGTTQGGVTPLFAVKTKVEGFKAIKNTPVGINRFSSTFGL
jgi:hypothetical protein